MKAPVYKFEKESYDRRHAKDRIAENKRGDLEFKNGKLLQKESELARTVSLQREEIEVLAPAVELARAQGMRIEGPVAPDSVFVRGLRGEFDAVLALYHDQAFIPLKLAGADSGVTFIPGLPYRRFSPMHGTAFDIVGKRRSDGQPVADPANLTEALRVASRITRRIAD